MSTRFMLSMIFPSSESRIMLLYLPIISVTSVSFTRSPISFVASKSINRIRSSSLCRMSVITAPVSRFRMSIQNIGGTGGLSMAWEVK